MNICAADPTAPSPVSAVALTACSAYRIKVAQLQEAERNDSSLSEVVQHALRVEVGRRTAALADLLTLSPTERLEKHLWELSKVIGQKTAHDEWRFVLPLRDADFALLIGISLRQFKRIKKGLQQSGHLRLNGSRLTFVNQH